LDYIEKKPSSTEALYRQKGGSYKKNQVGEGSKIMVVADRNGSPSIYVTSTEGRWL
jgi:hypothetical protein